MKQFLNEILIRESYNMLTNFVTYKALNVLKMRNC